MMMMMVVMMMLAMTATIMMTLMMNGDDENDVHDDDDDDNDDGLHHFSDEDLEASGEVSERPKIAVIVTVPFTERQYALTEAKSTVRVKKVKAAMKWLMANNILYKDIVLNGKWVIRHDDDDDEDDGVFRHCGKVCSVLPRLIGSNDEGFINVSEFNEPFVSDLFDQERVQDVYGLTPSVMTELNKYYTQNNFKQDNGLMRGDVPKVLTDLNSVELALIEMKPPKYAIVNGLMMGGVPKVLTDLNSVELALI